jgi:hypothetical protein
MQIEPGRQSSAAFTLAQGRAAGMTDAQMRRVEFDRPFHGVRVSAKSPDRGLAGRCAELLVALSPHAVLTHTTAARLWGMPLPLWMSDELHVTVPDAAAVRRAGVLGWRRTGAPPASTRVLGLPLATPAETWVSLATMTDARGGRVPRDWLVAVGDFLISGRRVRFGRDRPLASTAELIAALVRHGSRRGAANLDWALERVRSPVDSPRETFLRLGLSGGRMPEPHVQPPIQTAAGLRHPDLGYLEQRVLLEYLGDVHRTDRHTWRQDLQRVQLFEDAGYRTILVGADDLTPRGLPALRSRVRRALRT